MNHVKIAAVAALTAVAGCASNPEDIQASYVSPYAYQHLNCEQLVEEANRLRAALGGAYERQRKARSGDAAGIFFIGLPVSSMSGKDATDEIAQLKGSIGVIREEGFRKDCWAAPEGEAAAAEAEPLAGPATEAAENAAQASENGGVETVADTVEGEEPPGETQPETKAEENEENKE